MVGHRHLSSGTERNAPEQEASKGRQGHHLAQHGCLVLLVVVKVVLLRW